jgi:hypothetical protein
LRLRASGEWVLICAIDEQLWLGGRDQDELTFSATPGERSFPMSEHPNDGHRNVWLNVSYLLQTVGGKTPVCT